MTVKVEVSKVILEKKTLDIRISEDELLGRIILLVKEGSLMKKGLQMT